MAGKGGKRQAFNVPPISDLEEEIIKVTPLVFQRPKKADKEPKSTKDCAGSTITNFAEELDIKCREPKGPKPMPQQLGCLISDESSETDVKPMRDEQTEEERGFIEKGGKVHVGKNFMETFAFIEKTKHYEEPKAPKVASSSSLEAVSESTPQSVVPVLKSSNPNAIIVNQRQKGNPVLKSFRNVAWEYGDVIADYVMGPRLCALFLSTRYHNFNPNYIHDRLKRLGNRYELRVLLVQVDTKDPHKTLKELTKIAMLANCTLILAWSAEEAARYIEMYKIYENKPPDALHGQTSNDYLSKLTDCLTTVKSVNKTNVVTLVSTFESLENIVSASVDDIALCPGFGPQKAKRLHEAFHQPFVASKKVTEKDDSTSSKT